MKFLDIIGMSASNLWRRKLRTFLTVLGVMIGTASIVTMVSLGIGLIVTAAIIKICGLMMPRLRQSARWNM